MRITRKTRWRKKKLLKPDLPHESSNSNKTKKTGTSTSSRDGFSHALLLITADHWVLNSLGVKSNISTRQINRKNFFLQELRKNLWPETPGNPKNHFGTSYIKGLTIFAKRSILDIWQDPEYASGLCRCKQIMLC